MLRISAVDVDIGPVPILRGVSLQVPSGEMCGLIGRNGAGKTTLMRSVMGLLSAKRGTIDFEHHEMTKLASHRRAHLGIGYMPEDRRLVPELTAEQNIMVPVWSVGIDDPEDRLKWIYGLIPEAEEFRNRGATALSGGQQKMVAMARALMVGERLLLLDEPTEGIAPVLARRMGEILTNLKKEGLSVLVAESNDTHIGDLVDSTYIIERGSVSQKH